jgi:hypothetical protein
VITELQEASASSGSAESHGDSASITIPVGDFDNGEATEQGWRPVFEGVDIATPDGIHDAYARFMTFEAPRYHRRFFREACNRVPAGQEPEFMRAFASVQEFSLYQYRDFLEAIPQGWLEFPAIRRTLARLVKDIGSRFCLELANSNYDPFPFDLAARVAGLTESEIADVVLAALGESSEMFGAQRLFSLVSLLTLRLSSIGALEALAFGFSLFEAVTEVDDGDGPWSKALEPPSDIRAALAGYIWGGLASPRGAIRWEAAHVARAACELDRASLLARLIELMTSTTGGPFADSRLHFYGMHARQWLMIALARAAKANPRALLPHVDNLLMLACTSNPHVVIRKFAAEAVLAVIDSGLLGPRGQQLLLELTTLDVSPFPVVESGRYSRVSAKSDPNDNEQQLERFYFDMDFGPNWLRPLGDCFALSQRAVESIVTDVILHDWQWPSIDGRIEDQRIRQGVFRNGEHYASRASNPKTHGEHKYSWGLCRSGFWDVRVDRPESWEPVAERVCQGVV